MIIKKTFKFEAAHSLNLVPDGHPCKRLHGHSYKFTLVVSGTIRADGMVIDFKEIGKVGKGIIEQLDHRNLNDVIEGETTAERLAEWMAAVAKVHLGGLLHSVEVKETESTTVIYRVK